MEVVNKCPIGSKSIKEKAASSTEAQAAATHILDGLRQVMPRDLVVPPQAVDHHLDHPLRHVPRVLDGAGLIKLCSLHNYI